MNSRVMLEAGLAQGRSVAGQKASAVGDGGTPPSCWWGHITQTNPFPHGDLRWSSDDVKLLLCFSLHKGVVIEIKTVFENCISLLLGKSPF